MPLAVVGAPVAQAPPASIHGQRRASSFIHIDDDAFRVRMSSTEISSNGNAEAQAVATGAFPKRLYRK